MQLFDVYKNKGDVVMKNIRNLNPKQAVVFTNIVGEQLILIEGAIVDIVTDNTEFDEHVSGVIEFVNKDGIEVVDSDFIKWEYIEEVII